MTTHPSFDPWAELARIRAGGPNVSQLLPTLGERASEVNSLNNQDKSATLATLAAPNPENQVSAGPPEWTADHWRETYDKRLAAAMIDGEQPEQEARRIAHECCVVRWLDAHPVTVKPDHCAECGAADQPGNIVPFGAEPTGHVWLHPRCWPRWFAARRERAAAALASMGTNP